MVLFNICIISNQCLQNFPWIQHVTIRMPVPPQILCVVGKPALVKVDTTTQKIQSKIIALAS